MWCVYSVAEVPKLWSAIHELYIRNNCSALNAVQSACMLNGKKWENNLTYVF